MSVQKLYYFVGHGEGGIETWMHCTFPDCEFALRAPKPPALPKLLDPCFVRHWELHPETPQ